MCRPDARERHLGWCRGSCGTQSSLLAPQLRKVMDYFIFPCFFGLILVSGGTDRLLPSLQPHVFPSEGEDRCRGSPKEVGERCLPWGMGNAFHQRPRGTAVRAHAHHGKSEPSHSKRVLPPGSAACSQVVTHCRATHSWIFTPGPAGPWFTAENLQ